MDSFSNPRTRTERNIITNKCTAAANVQDTNNTKGAKAKRSIGKAIMTIKDGDQKGPPPKKMINVNGIMKINPEYSEWKNGASAPNESEVAVAHAETGMLMMDLSQVPPAGIRLLTCHQMLLESPWLPQPSLRQKIVQLLIRLLRLLNLQR
jgi:hypothetical protein